MALNTVDLLAAIRLRARLPASTISFTDTRVLQLATDVLWSEVVPMLLAEQQEYLVTRADVPLLAGVSDYPVPGGAVGSKLRNVQLVDNATGATSSLAHVPPESAVGWETSQGRPSAFLVEGGVVRLFPCPTGTENASLRFTHYARPAQLISSLSSTVVVAKTTTEGNLNGVTGLYLTLPSVATATCGAWSAIPDTPSLITLDFIRGAPPFQTVLTGVTCQKQGFTSLVVPKAISGLIQPGDWVVPTGFAPMPQVPVELHPMLCAKVAALMLASVGDLESSKMQAGISQGLEQRAGPLNTPRVDGAVIKQRAGIRGRW